MPPSEPQDDRQLTPARRRLIAASEASRYNLKRLSLAIGKNHSYLTQYVSKGSPKILPKEVRDAVAELLNINPADLLDGTGRQRTSVPAAAAASARGPELRVLREGQAEPAPNAPTFDAQNLIADLPGGATAIHLTSQHGILQPRNILICDPEDPGRLGDLVAVTSPGGLRIGLLVPKAGDAARLALQDTSGKLNEVPPGASWRVLSIRTS